MGVVVAAHHELLDQHVAVKLLYQDVADREAQSRLLLEARSAAKLQSEHVARVVDVDTGADGLPFIVMELLDGADLCQIADNRGALPRWLVVDYILQALEGLAHAHARGIIHRDLKPSNLFLANKPDGTQVIKILDFGISKSTSDEPPDRRTAQLTGGRSVLGSPPYMSPEQVRSPKTVDHRTDIWSLGICMYELLTNSMPFGGEQIQETFAQILEREPTSVRALVSGVPEGLERVIQRCISKKREERFPDVGELAKALAPYGSGTWIQSADRVAATLQRGADDATSGARLKGAPTSIDRVAIPSAPGRKLDSLQPELTGTARTVAKRFSVFDTQKKWMIAAAGCMVVGVGVFLGVLFTRSRSEPLPIDATGAPQSSASGETPTAANEVIPLSGGPAISLTTGPAHTAGPENEIGGPPPAGTVIGASPMASGSARAPSPVVVARPFQPPAPPPRRPPPPAATAKSKLPPGLPPSRD
ncbi:MAG TPA: serine/threonine-protein kinase [Labilithrix sp.]